MAPQLIEKDGVIVYIYGREHVPPHIHAFVGDDEALINIKTGEVFEGFISNKKLKVVKEWLEKDGIRELVEKNFYELNPRLKLPEIQPIKKIKKRVVNKKKKKGGK